MNKVILVGRISNDLELLTTKSGINYVRFSLAVSRRNSNNDITDFIPVTAWRNTAVFLSNNSMKGSRILVEGSFTSSRYTNSQGQNVTSYEVTADSVELMETKQQFEERKNNFDSNSSGYKSTGQWSNNSSNDVTFAPVSEISNHANVSGETDENEEEDWDLDSFI